MERQIELLINLPTLIARLKRNPEKDYWTEAVVFTTSNNSFGPTEISYLENRFCNLAILANRYDVKNGNDPTPGNITEEKECEMEEFIDNAKVIMGTLGHKLFEPVNKETPENNSTDQNDAVKLFLKRTKKGAGTVTAEGYQSPEGFVVLKGSHISPEDDDTIFPAIRTRRKEVKVDTDWVLQEDVLCRSPSFAAMLVIGKHANGLTSWKTKDGRTLKFLETT